MKWKSGAYIAARCESAQNVQNPFAQKHSSAAFAVAILHQQHKHSFLECFLQSDTLPTMTKLTPIESEFASTEEAEAYDAWLRAEVEASLADPRPPVPHDQVMAELHAIIAAKKAKRA